MKKEIIRAFITYQDARRIYEKLQEINPKHELISYTSETEAGLQVNQEFADLFHNKLAPKFHLPLSQFIQTRWRNYATALEQALENEQKR